MPIHQKKRAFEKARQPAMTKLGHKRIHSIRVRGGNYKQRALRLDSGNFCWSSQETTRKARIFGVVYNATNNELVRTNTLTKNTIVEVDATPFVQWYYREYGVYLGRKKEEEAKERSAKAQEKFEKIQESWKEKQDKQVLDENLKEVLKSGKALACIRSRPGQCGRADGYLLEGPELEFYKKKLEKKKGKK